MPEPLAAPTHAPQRRIGPYHVICSLGGGGQGRVLLAYDTRLQRPVAIKTYAPLEEDARLRSIALREARLQAAVDSPHVAQIYDVWPTGRRLLLVQQYVHGCDLQQLLGHGGLQLGTALLIMAEVAAGLCAAAAQGITHGDLKPGNILLGIDGRVRITDFGVAVRGVDARPRGGSAYTLAPEHLNGGQIGPRTDLFALGSLLYHLVCGRHPFQHTSDWPAALLQADYLPLAPGSVPPHLHGQLCALLRGLLQPDPGCRVQSAEQAFRMLCNLRRQLPAGSRKQLCRRVQALAAPLVLRYAESASEAWLWPGQSPARATSSMRQRSSQWAERTEPCHQCPVVRQAQATGVAQLQ